MQMVDIMFQVFERAKDLSRITNNERELLQFTTSEIKNIFTDFYAIKRAIRIKKKNRGFPFKKTIDDVIT
jgi:hypothetical protein